jgi:proteasome lid subunit RPN8/RPN11
MYHGGKVLFLLLLTQALSRERGAMNNIFDIEIESFKRAAEGEIELPCDFTSIGLIENGDVKVYLRRDISQAIDALSFSDLGKELGSILLGNYMDKGNISVVISAYIEAKYTEASASTLKFTHKTWEYIHKTREMNYPQLEILGWQHTHPGYGVFLSLYDMFIQENFFNLPFQIAYVIDPKQKTRGFFQWKNGKVARLGGYYIYD